ncbi:helix-turn-helix domain-containing protein [Arthrobacter gandavensis]|uniref:IclR family transcriptional regulator domain-containing protein n=1 Tax=Arthrobacter gandavensis TaxID=169960 RepID=UPI00188F3DAE|nr:IclR family transcriptional regulator C-terminal domain-containing protein [Arthrobacter gandavensis]MBF4995077.1 helix-turn-helix domain-containing protein [Arthrobacter gandavensis]
MGAPHGDWYVKSVEKTFTVLGAFSEETPLQSVSEVAAKADLSRAAARRFLLTLTELGFLSTDGARFQLAPRVLNIGSAFLSSLTLPAIAEPHLKSLSGDLQETASVCILDDVHVVYVARITSPRLVSVAVHVGTRFPAWATSMGRVLLASLEEADLQDRLNRSDVRRFTASTVPSREALVAEIRKVRERGWSVVREEYEEGLSGVAVPVHRGGRVVAAANVSLHQPYGRTAGLEEVLLPRLRRAAEDISADYGIRQTG